MAESGLKQKEKSELALTKVKIPLFLRLPEKTKIFFARYLAILLRSGMPLYRSVQSIRDHTKVKAFQRVLDIVLNDLNNGLFLGASLERFPKVFHPSFVAVVNVGERSGSLAESLNKLSEQMERNEELKGKVVTAFIYPAILIFASLGVAAYLVIFVIPNLLPVFTSLNVSLPFTTKIVIATSNFFVAKYWIVLIVLFVSIVGFRLLFLWEKFAYGFDWFLLQIPVIGGILRNSQISFFTRILSIMITSGVNIVDAIETTSNALSNRVYKAQLQKVADEMTKGSYIHVQLARRSKLFPGVVLQMIEVGETTGKLPDTLLFVSDFTEQEAELSIKRLSVLVEPAILVIMGFIVGFIALAVITPIYQLTTGI